MGRRVHAVVMPRRDMYHCRLSKELSSAASASAETCFISDPVITEASTRVNVIGAESIRCSGE